MESDLVESFPVRFIRAVDASGGQFLDVIVMLTISNRDLIASSGGDGEVT